MIERSDSRFTVSSLPLMRVGNKVMLACILATGIICVGLEFRRVVDYETYRLASTLKGRRHAHAHAGTTLTYVITPLCCLFISS